MQDIEFKKMIGVRRLNDDGYTYTYGKTAGLYKTKKRNKKLVDRCVRSDKRGVRQKALRRIFSEL